MHRRFLRLVAEFAGIALVFGVAACSSNRPVDDRCGVSSRLIPNCAVIWGIATDPNTNARLHAVEEGVGRTFDMVYRFHDINDRIPSADERALVRQGRILHVSIDARVYGAGAATVTWNAVANGTYDHDLAAQARGIASLHAPVFVTFDHEPDQPGRSARGTPADFVAAWRHVHDVFRRNGASNVIWVWVVTGYLPTAATAGSMWPGNRYVDWISWEAYNRSGCAHSRTDPADFRSFADSMLPFYTWLGAHAADYGINLNKPMMISEAGSVLYPTDPALTASWYRAIPDVLAAYPQIRAVGLWDRPGVGTCDYRFDDAPAVQHAVGQAGERLHRMGSATPRR